MISAVTTKQAKAQNMGGRKGIGQKRQTQPVDSREKDTGGF